jgi:hypothetical protein
LQEINKGCKIWLQNISCKNHHNIAI